MCAAALVCGCHASCMHEWCTSHESWVMALVYESWHMSHGTCMHHSCIPVMHHSCIQVMHHVYMNHVYKLCISHSCIHEWCITCIHLCTWTIHESWMVYMNDARVMNHDSSIDMCYDSLLHLTTHASFMAHVYVKNSSTVFIHGMWMSHDTSIHGKVIHGM